MTKPVYCNTCIYFCKEDSILRDSYCAHQYKVSPAGTSIQPSNRPSRESQCHIKNKDNDCPFYMSEYMRQLEDGWYTDNIASVETRIRILELDAIDTKDTGPYLRAEVSIFLFIMVTIVLGGIMVILHS